MVLTNPLRRSRTNSALERDRDRWRVEIPHTSGTRVGMPFGKLGQAFDCVGLSFGQSHFAQHDRGQECGFLQKLVKTLSISFLA
jgi:hypothetical protein